jgi:hypothetical protein
MNRTLILLSSALLVSLVVCGKPTEPAPASKPGRAGVDEAAAKPLPGPVRQGLWILEPADGAGVPYRPVVVGTVSDTSALPVFVIVRAVGMPDYWVQAPAAVRKDGMWLSQPYVGLTDTKPGISFEIRAVAAPGSPVQPGDKLSAWPDGRYQSQMVTVVRQ